MNSWRNKVVTTDDVCLSNLQYWRHWNDIKKKVPDLKLIAFVVANYRNQENVAESSAFLEWFECTRDWVQVGVHGYDHLFPPECERDNQEALIAKALKVLRPFLPKNYLYRAPGFQVTNQTEPILKRLGFAGIAHQGRIKFFDGGFADTFDTHCSNCDNNPVTEVVKCLAL